MTGDTCDSLNGYMGTHQETSDSAALLMDSSSTTQYKLGRKEGGPDLGYGETATLVLLPPSDRTDLSQRAR